MLWRTIAGVAARMVSLARGLTNSRGIRRAVVCRAGRAKSDVAFGLVATSWDDLLGGAFLVLIGIIFVSVG